MGLSCYVIEICGLFDTGLDYNFSSPLTAEVDEKKAVELVRTAFFSSTSAKPAARRAGMCDRREQIPQVRGYHSRFAPKPAAHLSVHNGSKSRNSVPLRNPPAGCTSSIGLLKQDGLSDPSHNGSKPRDSVPLRNPPPAASFFTALQETLLVTKKNCSHGVVLEQNDNQCVNVTCCGSNKFKNGRKHAAAW